MEKTVTLLVLLACLGAAPASAMGPRPTAAAPGAPQGEPSPVPARSPFPTPSAPPVTALPLGCMPGNPCVGVRSISGATDAETAMIWQGVRQANAELALPCFKQWVLAATYTENQGMTQQQIWDLMVRQSPVWVDVEIYSGSLKEDYVWRTVGWEADPWDGVVHMNRHFVDTAFMVADNLWHEAEGHSQGFTHWQSKPTSDPYGMNYAGEGCAQQRQQERGAPAYRPPGIRLRVVRRSTSTTATTARHGGKSP